VTPEPHLLLAASLAGPWDRDRLTERLAECPGWRGPDEIGAVTGALLARWRTKPRATQRFLLTELTALLATRRGRHIVFTPQRPRWRWPVAEWLDQDALAVGLSLRAGELSWFADTGGWLASAPAGPLHHYRRRWVRSRSGVPRLLEAPAPRLCELQRRVGARVLRHIPVHDAAHGYVRGRSALTMAEVHSGRAMVVRLDLEGFFSHVTGARVLGLMRTAGYPPAVASALAGLLVTTTPRHVLRTAPPASTDSGWEPRRRLLDRLRAPHLPQGAPSSPSVANLLAYRLDRRLASLASTLGAHYSRYADDLVFSGDIGLPVRGLVTRVNAIAEDEGFRTRPDKTRILPAHRRQRVTGLVVNTRATAARSEYDNLRALLHNCARTGSAAQNRSAHPAFRDYVLGRMGWVALNHPGRARRLRTLFEAIEWP
jgi:hypothetical protein